jgi:hypothetical protein
VNGVKEKLIGSNLKEGKLSPNYELSLSLFYRFILATKTEEERDQWMTTIKDLL